MEKTQYQKIMDQKIKWEGGKAGGTDAVLHSTSLQENTEVLGR